MVHFREYNKHGISEGYKTVLVCCLTFFHGKAIRLFSGVNSLGTVLNGQGTRGYMIVPHEYVIRFLQ